VDAVKRRSPILGVLKWIGLALLGLVTLVIVTAVLIVTSQDGSVRVLQHLVYSKFGHEPNSFELQSAVRDEVRADGLRVRTNIRYGADYPNSFLDIWYTTADVSVRRPTVIFLHGGGWFMGSKDWGDPFAAGGEVGDMDATIVAMAAAGFNVANMDYALAPEYRYPTPLIQLNQAIAHLRAHADIYGLDMSRVFIMGGSAGAQLTAQYGVVLSDPAYAAELGIEPTIDRGEVRGLILYQAPLNAYASHWRLDAMTWAYLGTQNLRDSRQVLQLDLIPRVNSRYPATYITDGNADDTFPAHAKAMAEALQRNGVDYVFNYYEPDEAILDHGYTARLNTHHGRENLERTIAFMQQRAAPR
jgi:acetyl esterase/lipase